MALPLKTKQLRRALSAFNSSLSSKDVRNRFLEYFIDEKNHQHVKSCSVFSHFDKSIPFVNAGMCQFKRIFTSQEQMKYDKAANTQKCIRIAGKHNDLQAVGIDSYHHTFFEMLGSWSFGSYDKEQACKLAWELLTSAPYNIPSHKLFVTYFGGDESLNLSADREVREIWLKLGVKPDHILPFGAKENFWEMGVTGPCGTCTEIHVALTEELCSSANLVNRNNPLLTELWNIVFIRYNRTENGTIERLPKEYVDTGMGFERLVALLQGKTSNYDSDLFMPLFETISTISKTPPYGGTFGHDNLDSSYRYLVDFSRMITVAISDNVFPDANPKLKRVLRKALFMAQRKFNFVPPEVLVNELTNKVAESLVDVFPEIGKNLNQVKNVIENEAKQVKYLENNCSKQWREIQSKYPVLKNFSFTEYPGLPIAYEYLMEQISNNKDQDVLPSHVIVNLYITHGLESDIIEQLLKPLGLKYDPKEVQIHLQRIRQFSKLQQREALDPSSNNTLKTNDSFKYLFENIDGNDTYEFPALNATILAVIIDNKLASVDEQFPDLKCHPNTNQIKEIGFVSDKTNFYTSAGGQCHDTGVVTIFGQNKEVDLKIHRVEKSNNFVIHFCDLNEIREKDLTMPFEVGDKVILKIDPHKRFQMMINHTAAHILNAAIKEVFPISHYKNGYVDDQMIVSNFSVYGYCYNNEDCNRVEEIVRAYITKALSVSKIITSSTLEVINLPGISFTPGETYDPDNIHIISILDQDGKVVSRELCCGTHLDNTRYIGEFSVTRLSFSKGLSKLVVEAVTGEKARKAIQYGQSIQEKTCSLINKIDNLLSTNTAPVNEVLDAFEELTEIIYELKYNKDCVKDSLPCSVAEDFHRLKALQKRVNKVISRWSREIVAMELAQQLYETSSQSDVVVRFFTLKHEALMDYDFLRELINLQEFNTKQKCPTLFITYVDGAIRCLCYVPEEQITEHFNAREWLLSILETSSIKIIETDDPTLSYTTPKTTPEENIFSLVKPIIERARCTKLN